MATRLIYLEEDKTGKKASNLITGETWSPEPGKYRLVVPKWGAFYWESLTVYNAANNQLVAAQHYSPGDTFYTGNVRSGKDIYTSFLLKETAPASVKITYQGYGGPQSRNAYEIVAWLNERLQTSTTPVKYSQLRDLPKKWNPIYHNHLLAHVFGMEYIVDALTRLGSAAGLSHDELLEQQYQQALVRLERMEMSANTTVEAIVGDAWDKFVEETALFNLGVDLLKNYPALGSMGAIVARPDFVLENEEDDRYVDLRGLGSFCKGLVTHVVSNSTGLGIREAVEREAQKGTFLGAEIGATFILPSPTVAKTKLYTSPKVYPEGYPSEDKMVVMKIAGASNSLAAVFSVINPSNGDQWLALLSSDSWRDPLTFHKVYYDDQQITLSDAVEQHLKARGAVHEENKEQLGLRWIENLPVIDVDNIVTDESKKMYLTHDMLMAYWRKVAEDIHLQRKENGEVDYDADLFDKMKVIIHTTECGPTKPPKDQFIESFCDGTDKYHRMTDGEGGFYDKLIQQNSADCGFVTNPEYGKKLGEFCDGTNLTGRYADGAGGSYTEVIATNSTSCGYVPPPPMGVVLAVFCSGINQMTRYADGKGGTYDMPTAINTYICGGEIYPALPPVAASPTPGTPSTPSTTLPSVRFSGTHTKLTPGTTEILSFYAKNLTPSKRFTFEMVVESDSTGLRPLVIDSGAFISSATGDFLWEQTRLDDGVTTERGSYLTWVRIPSENIESDQITRAFIKGTEPTKPDDTTNAGGGLPGSGTTVPPPPAPGEPPPPPPPPPAQDVNGDDYGSGSIWPPAPVYSPKVYLASDKPTLYLNSNETMTLDLTNFYADTTYECSFWTKHPKMDNGAPLKTLTIQLHTGPTGSATFNVSNYDDGSVPRGTTTDWVEVKLPSGGIVKSNNISRVFAAGQEAVSQWRQLSVTTSHSDIYIGTAYTQSLVLTGAAPNTKYQLELWRQGYTVGNDLVATVQVTTDGSGTGRYDITSRYDGRVPEPNWYQFYARLTGLDQMSNISAVTFVNKEASQTGRGIITFTSNQTTIKPGVTEVLTTTISDAEPNATINIEFWNQCKNYNNGIATRTHVAQVRIGSNGIGVHTLEVTDNGATPRGEYQSWIAAPSEYLVSRKITRVFLTADGTAETPKPTKMVLTYSTTHTTISPGTKEIITVSVTGGIPNTKLNAELYASSAALNNGNVPVKGMNLPITTNSQGAGSSTVEQTDNGITPRGTYVSWAEIEGVKSPMVNRTFIGTPPPAANYNPKIVHSVSATTISPGMRDDSTLKITGCNPNSQYHLEYWLQGANAFNGEARLMTTATVVTDSKGAASHTNEAVDNGTAVPRGTYTSWGILSEVGIKSNIVTRTFIGTPPPTPPVYNPQVRYWSDMYIIIAGSQEPLHVALSGMKANTNYNVDLYFQSPAVFNNEAYKSLTIPMRTDQYGNAEHALLQYDNGTAVPRGTYQNWAIIQETGTSSSTFTRVFA